MNQVVLAQNTPAPAAVAPAAIPTSAAGPTPVPTVAPPAAGGPAPTTATVGAQPPAQQGPGGIAAFFASPIFLLILMFVVFYFLLIRPQQKKQKAHLALLGNLKKGDEVLLTTGIFGRIVGLQEQVATLEIADRVRIRVLRSQISGLAASPTAAQDVSQRAPAPEQK